MNGEAPQTWLEAIEKLPPDQRAAAVARLRNMQNAIRGKVPPPADQRTLDNLPTDPTDFYKDSNRITDVYDRAIQQ